jgi:hypothetical protein
MMVPRPGSTVSRVGSSSLEDTAFVVSGTLGSYALGPGRDAGRGRVSSGNRAILRARIDALRAAPTTSDAVAFGHRRQIAVLEAALAKELRVDEQLARRPAKPLQADAMISRRVYRAYAPRRRHRGARPRTVSPLRAGRARPSAGADGLRPPGPGAGRASSGGNSSGSAVMLLGGVPTPPVFSSRLYIPDYRAGLGPPPRQDVTGAPSLGPGGGRPLQLQLRRGGARAPKLGELLPHPALVAQQAGSAEEARRRLAEVLSRAIGHAAAYVHGEAWQRHGLSRWFVEAEAAERAGKLRLVLVDAAVVAAAVATTWQQLLNDSAEGERPAVAPPGAAGWQSISTAKRRLERACSAATRPAVTGADSRDSVSSDVRPTPSQDTWQSPAGMMWQEVSELERARHIGHPLEHEMDRRLVRARARLAELEVRESSSSERRRPAMVPIGALRAAVVASLCPPTAPLAPSGSSVAFEPAGRGAAGPPQDSAGRLDGAAGHDDDGERLASSATVSLHEAVEFVSRLFAAAQ